MSDLPVDFTSLAWAGLQRTASESLVHSARTPNATEAEMAAEQAIADGREALKAATNKRQSDVTEALLDASHKVKARARQGDMG